MNKARCGARVCHDDGFIEQGQAGRCRKLIANQKVAIAMNKENLGSSLAQAAESPGDSACQ